MILAVTRHTWERGQAMTGIRSMATHTGFLAGGAERAVHRPGPTLRTLLEGRCRTSPVAALEEAPGRGWAGPVSPSPVVGLSVVAPLFRGHGAPLCRIRVRGAGWPRHVHAHT